MQTPTADAVPTRSPARAILAGRLAVRERALAKVAEITEADRRLDGLRREAEQLAADVAGADGRAATAELALRLVTVNAKIASSGPERARLAAEMLGAGHELHAATLASQVEVTNVMTEEVAILARQIDDLNDRLLPLLKRMAGLRGWALGEGHSGGSEDHRSRHLNVMQIAADSLARLYPGGLSMIPADSIKASWAALAEALMSNADAQARPC